MKDLRTKEKSKSVNVFDDLKSPDKNKKEVKFNHNEKSNDDDSKIPTNFEKLIATYNSKKVNQENVEKESQKALNQSRNQKKEDQVYLKEIEKINKDIEKIKQRAKIKTNMKEIEATKPQEI